MTRYERILKLHQCLSSARYPVSFDRLKEELRCSRATLYRDVAFLRDALNAPVHTDKRSNTVVYDRSQGDRFELPGLWLNSEELHGLLAFQQVLASSTPGLFAHALAPLKQRIEKLLARPGERVAQDWSRIRVATTGKRRLDEASFRTVATAVLERHRLKFRYQARTSGSEGMRCVSPQRLTHYRENWYLDAYDHDRRALRSFAADRIRDPAVVPEPALEVPDSELDAHLAGSYGIFAGPAKAWATILFSARAARWVADEQWHSRQEGRFREDGRYELRIPYANAKELLMDVLRYGPDAEVVAPPALREEAKIMLTLALAGYQEPGPHR